MCLCPQYYRQVLQFFANGDEEKTCLKLYGEGPGSGHCWRLLDDSYIPQTVCYQHRQPVLWPCCPWLSQVSRGHAGARLQKATQQSPGLPHSISVSLLTVKTRLFWNKGHTAGHRPQQGRRSPPDGRDVARCSGGASPHDNGRHGSFVQNKYLGLVPQEMANKKNLIILQRYNFLRHIEQTI